MANLELKLNVFEGPLDLLLHLIEKNKYNIFDIPIVEITDQYIEYLDAMDETDMDVMSEFLVMAAQLIAIKAKMLLPKEEETVEETAVETEPEEPEEPEQPEEPEEPETPQEPETPEEPKPEEPKRKEPKKKKSKAEE